MSKQRPASPDHERIEATKQCYRDLWAYQRVDHIPVFIRITGRLGHTRREIIENDELQYQINLNNLDRSLRILPDDYIPYARVWFGYMTIATMFGLPVHWGDSPDQSPGVAHPLITDMDAVYRLKMPQASKDGLMPDNLRVQRLFADRFPKWVYLTGFDLGGPLNSCRDLIESSVLYTAMIEQPEALHHLLDLLTELQIACYQAEIEAAGGLERMTQVDMAQVWAPEGHKGFISDDVCSTISPAMFETFSKPYNNRIFAHWPGGLLHNCGPHPAADRYLDHTPPINGINCSFRYTRDSLPTLRKAFAGRGLVQVMFDNGETAEAMIAGFQLLKEELAPDVIALPIAQVDDSWSDAEIADLYHAMREVAVEYAANVNWRE
jgi:uroporphyrinogen-III decarboxylase